MTAYESSRPATNLDRTQHFEAMVVGAGFGGLRMLWELRKLGLSARVLEAGTNVGGTWYWNRYPGARTDSEAWVYCFSFDKDLQNEWEWAERFPQQKDMERYFQHVADRFDMRKDIQFNTRVVSAEYDEIKNLWTVGTDQDELFTCTYLVSATGLLHVAKDPPFEGLKNFQGEWYMTSNWPKQPVEFAGKRVAIIGTGATGVQLIPVVAQMADHLTVFQRTANYVTPGRNYSIEAAEQAEIRRNYEKIWKQTEKHVFGFAMEPAGRVYGELSPDQHRQILDAGWEAGGFRFLFQTFDDLLIDERSNAVASEFMRNKIRAIVKDPEVAERLCPKDHPFAAKRPPMGNFYYETYNRDNVSLVNVRENSIERITDNGIRLRNGEEYEVDIIIFALGFDALTGALSRMNVRGRGGQRLEEKWRDGPHTYLGICVDGFPNLFMISGPQSCFANIPVVIDKAAIFIGQAIAQTLSGGARKWIEPTPEAVEVWGKHCQELLEYSPIIKAGASVNSWNSGSNLPGKASGVYFYYGGAAGYFSELNKVVDRDYEGFV